MILPAFGRVGVSQIENQIQDLRQSLKDRPLKMAQMADANTNADRLLNASAASLRAGRVYLSLERLNEALEFLQGIRYYVDKADAVKGGLPAFEAEWGKASQRLTGVEKELRAKDWTKSQAALRALSETAQSKTVPLMDGSRGFASATKPADGLFYLGQAQAQGEFASFCGTLDLPRKGQPLPLRSMFSELMALQEKTNAAFQPPRSVDLHPKFITLNSTIKLARELDSSKLYAGALYQYLEALQQFALLDAPPIDAARQSELKKAIAALGTKLAASKDDDSLAQIFVQRAQSQLNHGDGSASSPDEWRSAAVLLDQVMPAYFAARKPAAEVQRSAVKTVELTLIRWPYT